MPVVRDALYEVALVIHGVRGSLPLAFCHTYMSKWHKRYFHFAIDIYHPFAFIALSPTEHFMVKADFRIAYHGSIVLVSPMTKGGRDFLEECIGEEATYWSDSLVVEPRYLENLLQGILDHGLLYE